jgi:hypothetical protein
MLAAFARDSRFCLLALVLSSPAWGAEQPAATRQETAERILQQAKNAPDPTAEVRRLLNGDPRRIARQILYRRHIAVWVYEAPIPLRIEFDHVQGQPPQILSVQPLTEGWR